MRELITTFRMLGAMAWPLSKRWLRRIVITFGIVAVILCGLAFTRIPFDAHRWLGTAAGECAVEVKMIVLLGGSGMPSGPELLRLHRAAELAGQWPSASVAIIHPGDERALHLMRDELILRGVDSTRIELLNKGDNTRAQALALAAITSSKADVLAIVSAPENMYRSVRSFKRVGFTSACGAPAWDHAMFHEFDYEHERIGGKAWAPDVSDQPALRYTFWNYLKLEVTCLREYVAIGYYWINGWI